MKHITEQDLTFVVQGIINPTTPRTIASIQRFFPRSPIIVSTHKTDSGPAPIPTNSMDGFLSVQISDPGPSKNNLLRQICTSRVGLRFVQTEFSIKIRSDIEFVHGDLLENYNNHLPSVSLSTAFTQPVGIVDVFTYHPHVLPLFLSDFIAIGRTKDVQKIFDCPLPSADMEHIYAESNPDDLMGTRIGPEQYLAWHATGKRFASAKGFASDQEKQQSLESVKNDYIVLDMGRQAGLGWHKNPYAEQMAQRDCLHNEGWRNL